MTKSKKINPISLILSTSLGIALGASWMTSLRFYKFGLSEFFFLVFTIILFCKYHKSVFNLNKDHLNIMKLYFFIIIFVIAPFNTFFFNKFGTVERDLIIYFFSFFLFFLTFYIDEKIIDFKLASNIFALIFLPSLIYSVIIYEFFINNHGVQFVGLSNNPNQVIFSILFFSFFTSMYNKKILYAALPILMIIGIYTKTQALFYSLIISFVSIILFILIRKIEFNFFFKKILIPVILVFTAVAILFYHTEIHQFIIANVEGSKTRFKLIYNALVVIYDEPIFGHGVGSFSGRNGPYLNNEAHNTFLDFSIQFGLIFSIIIYLVFIFSAYFQLNKKEYLNAFTNLSFVIFTLFHFFGRHFVFFFILALLLKMVDKELRIRKK